MTPIYLTKSEMQAKWEYPYYGYTVPHVGVWVRSDLPVKVQISVRAHEMQHFDANAFADGRVWYWEARAWAAGFKASPAGFFQAIWMSITDVERVKLYWARITKKF